MSKLKDRTGQICGGLEVLRRCDPPAHGSKKHGAYFMCRCVLCSSEVIRRGGDLSPSKAPQSCGCKHRDKIMVKLAEGVELEGLVIIEKAPGYTPKHPKWLCKCKKCHELKAMWASALHKMPNRPDCGCGRRGKGGSQEAPPRFYEPGICPDVETCGPCQRSGRAACFYSAAQLSWFRACVA